MYLHGALNSFMLGTTQIIGSSMLEKDDPNFEAATNSYLYVSQADAEGADGSAIKYVDYSKMDGLLWSDWQIPNILYSPDAIFGNKIAALDVNFINPHEYTAIEYRSQAPTEATVENKDEATTKSRESSDSIAAQIAPVISSWYKAFRNIAIVGLLSVLIYIGIRILIGSTAQDKAKYKERLTDWVVALCLVFIMHLIMSGILMATEKITDLFSSTGSELIVVFRESIDEEGNPQGDIKQIGESYGFRTNLIGYVRLMAQYDDWSYATAYTTLYIALIIYTVMFTFIYFKRVLYMAFFTMIAPLVALTYPLDKLGDSKSQAFNIWFKEYLMNAIIQPVHLILYTVLISSAMDLAVKNPLYALVAIGFLIPAEKFIKKLFGFDKAETPSGLGAFAGGALTMKGVGAVAGLFKGNGSKSKKGGDSDSNESENSLPTRGKSVRYNDNNPLATAVGLSGNPPPEGLQSGNDNDSQGLRDYTNQPNNLTNPPNEPGLNDSGIYGENGNNNIYSNRNTIVGEDIANNPDYRADPNHSNILLPSNVREDLRRREIGRRETGRTPQQEQEEPRDEQDNQNIEPDRSTAWKRFKLGAGAVGGNVKRSIKNTVGNKDVWKKRGISAVKFTAKNGVKLAAAAGGAMLLGTVAAGAALTTGDISKGASIAAGGIAAGAGLGGKAGGAITKKAGGSIKSNAELYKTAALGSDEIKRRKQEAFDRDFKNSKQTYNQLIREGFSAREADDFIRNDMQDFLDAGITDTKLMANAKKLENKKRARGENFSRERTVALAGMANKLSDKFNSNLTEQNSLRENVQKRDSRINNTLANNLIDDLKDLKK